MKTLGAVMVVCGLAGCAQTPPEPTLTGQVPEFTVLSAVPRVGDLDFSVSEEGHLEGTLTLHRQLDTVHPIRLSVVWREAQYGTFEKEFWSSLLLQEGQQLVSSPPASAGTHAFAADLGQPPSAAVRVRSGQGCVGGMDKYSRAALVVFVDTNENGTLDLSTGPAIDHVLSSTEFPTLMLGDQLNMNELGFSSCTFTGFWASHNRSTQPVYDDPRLDLVACGREDRFAVEEACGISNQSTPVFFFGERNDDLVSVRIAASREVSVFVDGLPRDGFSDASLALGSHQVRADRGGVAVWEATFTFPDRTWVKALKPAGPKKYDVHFQEVAGATDYFANAGLTVAGGGNTSPIRIETNGDPQPLSRVGLTANFGELPFRCTTLSGSSF